MEQNRTAQDVHGFSLFHVMFSGLKLTKPVSSNFLVTYNGKRAPDLDKLVAAKEQGIFTGRIFMDSGAFPAFKKNTDLDIDAYIAYVNEVGDPLYGIAQLDYIGRLADGTPEERQAKSTRLSWERFRYMWERVRPELRHKLIYIVHEAEEIEPLLARALMWRDSRGQGIGYLGVGLSSPNKLNRDRHTATVEKVCKHFGYTGNIHAFGVQQIEIIQHSNYFTSSDSSSAVRDQMTGCIEINGQHIKIQPDTSLHHKSDISAGKYSLMEPYLRERAAALGIDYELARVNPGERYLWGCKERDLYFKENVMKKAPVRKRGLI